MTAVLFSKSETKAPNLSPHTVLDTSDLNTSSVLANLSATIKSKVSPTSSNTENEPKSPLTNHQNKSQPSTMQNSEDLILNTNFNFHAPTFSPQLLQEDSKRGHKRVVTDHVLENGERVVVVDPNISEDEEDDGIDQTLPQPQISPLDKAISSLFAAASKSPPIQQQTPQRKRSISPKPKTVSGILAAKRRKVEKPQKRDSESDFQLLNDSLLGSPSASAFLNALTSSGPSTSSSHRKSTNTRPSSSNSDLNTSKGSLSDSGIVSADEHPVIVQPMKRGKAVRKPRLGGSDTIPAPVLQLLINAAGGDVNSMSLSDLLASDPTLLKSINEVISANPSQQHTLQIVPTPPVKEEPKIKEEESYFSTQNPAKPAQQPQYPTADQINAALALWPDLINTASKLDEQTAARILSACAGQNDVPLNNNEESRVQSDREEESEEQDNQELLRLGSEWLLRELFKGKSIDKPQTQQQQSTQPVRKRKLELQSPQTKSSESVSSQLKTPKGKNQDELEELEQFASYFKRQRIKHGFTQGDVGTALGRRYGTDFSQTTISRFEALNLSFKNMCKLRPLMEEWMNEAEAAIMRGATVADIVEADTLKPTQDPPTDSMDDSPPPTFNPDSPFGNAGIAKSVNASESRSSILMSSISPSGVPGLNSVLPTLKKRRKRTNLDNQQKDRLHQYFNVNFRPTHEEMQRISDELGLDADVIRVWFCNMRQKLRKV